MDYFKTIADRIYPVGRLDFDTSGLLIMSNDGDFTNCVLHPKYKIDKVYQVLCQGIISDFQLHLLQTGVRIAVDFVSAPAKVVIINYNKGKRTTLMQLTIHEGHKNQIKKMLQQVGSKVLALQRIAIANLTLANLQPGQFRELTNSEVFNLLNLSKKGYDAMK